jgi:hypothetical protein
MLPPFNLKHILRALPIETFALVGIYFPIFLTIFFLAPSMPHWHFDIRPLAFLVGPMAGTQLLRYPTLLLFFYAGFLLVRYFTGSFGTPGVPRGIARAVGDPRTLVVARSAVFWFFVTSVFVLASSSILTVLFHSFSHQAMGRASDLLMHMDKFIFGMYPPFFLNTLHIPGAISWFIVAVYMYIPFLFGILLTFLFCTHTRFFRSCFLALGMATVLSLPFWIIFPGIAPNEIYRHNTLDRSALLPDGKDMRDMVLAPHVSETLAKIEAMWIDKSGKSFSVTTFPSMHVIWATFFLFYLYRMHRYSLFATLPLYVANAIGTMLLLEHYAVDVLLGIPIAFLAIYIAERLLRFESSYFVDRLGLLAIFDAVQFPPRGRM